MVLLNGNRRENSSADVLQNTQTHHLILTAFKSFAHLKLVQKVKEIQKPQCQQKKNNI